MGKSPTVVLAAGPIGTRGRGVNIPDELTLLAFVVTFNTGSNDSLEHLDLSWNHIRRQGAIEIANGLRVSKADQNSLLSAWPDVKTYMYTFVFASC